MSIARVVSAIVVLLPGLVAAQAPSDSVRTLVRGQRMNADGAVRVWNLLGSVRVVGWAHDSIAVTARVAAGAPFHFGGGPRGVKLGVEERGGSAATGDIEVRVPRGAKVWVKSSTAPITVSGVVGDVELYTVTGDVRVSGRPATLRIEALAAPVTVQDGADWLRARTSSGAIRVAGAVGDAELATVGGALTLDGAVTQQARLESVTGAVRQRGAIAGGATLAIETNSGDVALQLARGRTTLDLLTLGGRITSAIPAVRAAVRPQKRGQALRTDAGANAGRIEVRSFKGAIVVEDDARKGAP